MSIHRTFVAVIVVQLVFVLVGSAMAAPTVAVSVTTTSSDLKVSARNSAKGERDIQIWEGQVRYYDHGRIYIPRWNRRSFDRDCSS